MGHSQDGRIGARLKARRVELKRSQAWLGERVGVTFQQVQKYEKGLNRISAAQLQAFAQALQKPVDYFYDSAFEAAPIDHAGFGESPALDYTPGDGLESAIARIVKAIRVIGDPKIAMTLATLAEAIQQNKAFL